MLKIQLCITGINYILKCIQIENCLFKIVIIFHNINVFTCILNQINAELMSIRHVFQRHKKS